MNTPHLAHRAAAIVLLATGAALAPPAQAARPFVTDDAGVLARGACEAEPVLAHSRAKAQPSTRAVALQGACGLGYATQLAAGYARATGGGASSSALTLGGKTRLADGGDQGVSYTLAYGTSFVRGATGGRRYDGVAINLLATVPLSARLQAHGNLGWLQSRSADQQGATWAAALEAKASDTLDIGAEAYGDSHGKPWLGAGLRWSLGEQLSLNASLAARAGGDKGRLGTLGARFAF